MKNWLSKENNSEYKRALKNSFPKELGEQLNEVFKVIPFNTTKIKNFYNQEYDISGVVSEDSFDVLLDREKVTIPYRVYFSRPIIKKETNLNQVQKDIINSIYTRHHNGKIRQESLEKLKNNNSYWTTPFRVQLLGEYVYEIYETLSEQLNDQVLDNCKRFFEENPKIAHITKDRVISYYGIYYKWKHPKFKNYLGKEIFDRINQKFIGVDQEEITQIGLDSENRFFIKPKKKEFSMIFRLAKGIDWNGNSKLLRSTPIKEWKKYKWYLHMLFTIYKEYGIELIPTKKTEYSNLDRKTTNQIRQNKKRPHNTKETTNNHPLSVNNNITL